MLLTKAAFILAIIILNAFFVVAEFSLIKIRKGQLEELKEEGKEDAARLLDMLQERESYVSIVQLGITSSSLLLGWYGGPLISAGILHLLQLNGLQGGYSISFSVVCAFLLIVLLHVVLGELVPRTVALVKLEKLALAFTGPLRILYFFLAPLAFLTNKISRGVTWLIGIRKVPNEDISRSEEELRLIVSASEKDGELDKVESVLIANVFNFNDRVAREVMVPRQDMICLFSDDTLTENLDAVRESRHTRYPLCESDKDHVVGMIHVRDLMDLDKEKEDFDLREIMRELIVVPEGMRTARILQTMQQKQVQIAVVADEYGGTAGILTLEDLLEELVGEIHDEHDLPEVSEVVKLPDGDLDLDGLVLLDEIEDIIPVSFNEPEEDTIGGYIFGQLGRKPEVGDAVEVDGWTFTAVKVNKFRIQRVRASKADKKEQGKS